ncbi:MAG TPA: hypothetical protein VLU25_04995 [Acidobacteriota bacterium]|nr:hypothetical protein [Acidobacteriota bacterium]
MVIRRFGIFSVAKIFGAVYGTMGLIFGCMLALASLAGGLSAMSDVPEGGIIGAVLGVGAIIILPLFYGIIGMIGGAISAALYNLFASMVGGVQVDLEQVPAPAARRSP